jgi:hypothetical protein
VTCLALPSRSSRGAGERQLEHRRRRLGGRWRERGERGRHRAGDCARLADRRSKLAKERCTRRCAPPRERAPARGDRARSPWAHRAAHCRAGQPRQAVESQRQGDRRGCVEPARERLRWSYRGDRGAVLAQVPADLDDRQLGCCAGLERSSKLAGPQAVAMQADLAADRRAGGVASWAPRRADRAHRRSGQEPGLDAELTSKDSSGASFSSLQVEQRSADLERVAARSRSPSPPAAMIACALSPVPSEYRVCAGGGGSTW